MREKLLFALTITLMLTCYGCGQKDAKDINPLMAESSSTLSNIPFEQIRPQHFLPAIARAIKINLDEVNSIANNNQKPTFENTIAALDNSGAALEYVSRLFRLYNGAKCGVEIQAAGIEIFPLLSSHNDTILHNAKLFERVSLVYQSSGSSPMNVEQKRLTELTYNRFIDGGAELSREEQSLLGQVNSRLAMLETRFGYNTLEQTKDFALTFDDRTELSSFAQYIVDNAGLEGKKRGFGEKLAFTLDLPSYTAVLTYLNNVSKRNDIFTAYMSRGANGNEYDNREIVSEILKLRHTKASILGYESYAELITKGNMADTQQKAIEFLDNIWARTKEATNKELEILREQKSIHEHSTALNPWDILFCQQKMEATNFSLNTSAISNYFTAANVTRGIFQLCNRLWGITFRPLSIDLYDPDCVAYQVFDIDNSELGTIYLDLYPRDDKMPGEWCEVLIEQHRQDTTRVDPTVALVANFGTRPRVESPMLSIDETKRYFGLFSEAMSELLSDVKYKSTGNFGRFPTRILENWAFEPSLLRFYAIHRSSNEVISESFISTINQIQNLGQGIKTAQELAATYTDLGVHSLSATSIDSFDINSFEQNTLYIDRAMNKEIESPYRLPFFTDIFDVSGRYAACYYGHLWAEKYEKDAFEAFVESGNLYNRDVAQSLRREIFERGGDQNAAKLYRNFRGSDPAIDAMLRMRGLMERIVAPEASAPAADTMLIEMIIAN